MSYLHMEVYGSFMCICQNLEATEVPFHRWIDKWWYIGILFNVKNKAISQAHKSLEELIAY